MPERGILRWAYSLTLKSNSDSYLAGPVDCSRVVCIEHWNVRRIDSVAVRSATRAHSTFDDRSLSNFGHVTTVEDDNLHVVESNALDHRSCTVRANGLSSDTCCRQVQVH